MLNLLLAQERRYKIPAGLPSGVKSGNKTGETDSYQHDAAIVYGKKTDYVIVVFAQVGEYTGINGIKYDLSLWRAGLAKRLRGCGKGKSIEKYLGV